MSQIYVPNVGEKYLLENGIFGKAGSDVGKNMTLGLFKNDLSVSNGTVLSDIVPADFTDYAAKTLNADEWVYSIVDNKAHAEYAQQNFIAGTIGVSCTVYGVYCYVDTELVFVERFDTEIVVNTTGQVISYVPVIEASTA